ncbi:pentatricopeptide repeat-containing protein At4g13650-like [Typha angustifolia]|uniref:pentatricopeptide repeat-containing protein At4g13650-like n=1 Tax=Typha angustifolia TaxID=59011 RepID=UPI003C2D6EA1
MPSLILCSSSSPSLLLPYHIIFQKSSKKPTQDFTSIRAIYRPTTCANGIRSTHAFSLLQSYTRTGSMDAARELFDEMPNRTLVAWTMLMSGYVLNGLAFEALSLFRDMLRQPLDDNIQPDPFVFSVMLRACASTASLDFGRELHCAVLKLGYLEDLFVANALVTSYASCGYLHYSERVFDGICRPDVVSWTAMLSGYIKHGHNKQALRLFLRMTWGGISLDAFVLSVGLKASGNLGHTCFGAQIHCCIIKLGLSSCLFLENCVIEFYGRIGELRSMRQVFDKMFEKDLVSWNTIIECYTHNNCDEEALMLFRTLMLNCSQCDRYTLGSALHAVTRLGDLCHGKEVHAYMIRMGFDLDTHVISALLDMYIDCQSFGVSDDTFDAVPFKLLKYSLSAGAKLDEFIVTSSLKSCASRMDLDAGKLVHAFIVKLNMKSDGYVMSSLIDMYAKCGILEAAFHLFLGIKNPDSVLWSTIIAGNCWNFQFRKSLQLFREMQLEHIKANDFTYTSTLLACIALGDLTSGKEIHCNAIRNGYGSIGSIVKCLINLYSEVRQVQQALRLCSSIPECEIPWDSLVQSLNEVKDHEEILRLFEAIQRSHGRLDHSSAFLILNSCGRLARLDAGFQAHAYITKRGLASDPHMSNALIKMYSSCGKLTDAINAFNYMPEKNSSSWTSIISANVDNGCPPRAIELFKHMLRKGKSPNSSTFASVLKACAQIGVVDEAFRFFELMSKDYKINASAEHYYSMLEVLSHADMFREAEHFIDNVIPFESRASAWRAIFHSGQECGNMKVARHAAKKLLELNPTDSLTNVFLGEILVASGEWSNVSKIAKGFLKEKSDSLRQ